MRGALAVVAALSLAACEDAPVLTNAQIQNALARCMRAGLDAEPLYENGFSRGVTEVRCVTRERP